MRVSREHKNWHFTENTNTGTEPRDFENTKKSIVRVMRTLKK